MEAFIEKQRFMKYWWWVALTPCIFVFVIPFIVQSKNPSAFGSPEMWIGPVIIITVFALLFSLTLSSRISSDGIEFKFNIFQFKPRKIAWNEVRTIELGKYNALAEYGGWGYRKGWKKKKVAYNVAGDVGLKIVLNDGREIMLGTQEERKMQEYLYYLKTKYQLAALSDVSKP